MLQFACTARAADDEDYRPLAETPLTLDFAYDHGVSTLADPAVWQVTLTNNADAPWRGVVKLEHCVAHDAPRFFLPGFLYDRNRGEAPIRVDNRYPRLRAGTPEFPASPWWMVRADRLSHPAAFLLDGGRWYGLSAAPYFVRQNGVLQPWQPGRAGTFAQFAGFTCSLNTGSVGYTLGYENAPWLFVQSHNIKPRAPMGENCLTLAAGESVAFPLYLYDFVAVDGERTLYAALEAVYGLWHTPPCPACRRRTAWGMRRSALRPLPASTILCRTLWTRAAACPTKPGTPKTAGAVGAGGSTACTRAGIPAIWSDRRFIIS